MIAATSDPEVPLLMVELHDLSEDHLRPDFIDEMFLAQSDSDEDEDLDHLCKHFGSLRVHTGIWGCSRLKFHQPVLSI